MGPPTIFLPLHDSSPLPESPSFLVPSSDPAAHISKVYKAIVKAKRIVIVCGAGISVQAGIPDFRSSEGLFQSLKKENPKEILSSATLFYQMIARLSELSQVAQPTPFHHLLRFLDTSGKLLRVYTQNIDAIEVKSGLSFGVPRFKNRRHSQLRARRAAGSTPSSSPRPLSTTEETPKCIPLHGTLQTLHCPTCNHSCPLDEHLPLLSCGIPPGCPECAAMEETRQLVGKRARGVGKLRPSVVLYNEAHMNGEGVGEVVARDLVGASRGKGRSGAADLLLVVGTSLRVPGTKRIVREFAKAVRPHHASAAGAAARSPSSSPKRGSPCGLPTPTSSPRLSSAPSPSSESSGKDPPVRSVYLNLDFPVPTRDWEGVFDVWVQGDAQTFAERLTHHLEQDLRRKELVRARKKRREEREGAFSEDEEGDGARQRPKGKRRREVAPYDSPTDAAKRRKGASIAPSSFLRGPVEPWDPAATATTSVDERTLSPDDSELDSEVEAFLLASVLASSRAKQLVPTANHRKLFSLSRRFDPLG